MNLRPLYRGIFLALIASLVLALTAQSEPRSRAQLATSCVNLVLKRSASLQRLHSLINRRPLARSTATFLKRAAQINRLHDRLLSSTERCRQNSGSTAPAQAILTALNLIANGDFELGTSNWNIRGGSMNTMQTDQGRSAIINVRSASNLEVSQAISIAGSPAYDIQAWYKREAALPSVALRIQWYRRNSGRLELLSTQYILNSELANQSWNRLSGQVAAPATAVKMRLSLMGIPGQTPRQLTVDNVTVIAASGGATPSPTVTPNLSPTPTRIPTTTPTATASSTPTQTATPTRTATPTPTLTPTPAIVPTSSFTPVPGGRLGINGIPDPSFGIGEAHTMYAGRTYNFGSGPSPYPNAGNGPFTHYVDNSHPLATDSSNPFGSPTRPRRSIPLNLSAGAVVEVHGGPYAQGGVLSGNGLATQPIFIRGVNQAQRPIFTTALQIQGSYLIVENIELTHWSSGNQTGVDFSGHHLVLRGSEVHHDVRAIADARCCSSGINIDNSSDIVVYGNKVHDNGNVNATTDEDHHGIHPSEGASNVWIVDNEMYRNSGDGLQINAGNLSLMNTTHHIFVGRNIAYQNKQTGFWSKFATDVIFSQNIAYNHHPSDSSPGAGMGWQYGPERLWFLFNLIFDTDLGITSATRDGPGGRGLGQNYYFIGNIIHDIHSPPSDGWQTGIGIRFTDEEGGSKFLLNNTVFDVDGGIYSYRGSAELRLINNLLGGFSRLSPIFVENTQSMIVQSSNLLNAQAGWFINSGAGDFHLSPSSPAIDAGQQGGLQAVLDEFHTRYGVPINMDFDGRARPQGQAIDVGALEVSN